MLIYIIFAAIAVIVILPCLIMFIRSRRFKPNPDKAQQLKKLNYDLRTTGFAYDYRGDYFYSLPDCWQKEAGYCSLYDETSPLFNMVMDCEPIMFSCKGKKWLIELWKGQYGITTGAEIGFYCAGQNSSVYSDRFTGTFYDAVDKEDELNISFILYKNGKKLFAREDKSWWVTAFRLGEFSDKTELAMRAKIKFNDREMLKAFTDALIRLGYTRHDFRVIHGSVIINFISPRSPQPISQNGIGADAVQRINRTNCDIFNTATSKFTDTADKIEYLSASIPELYDFMLSSMYGKEFFKTFEWLIRLIRGKKPTPPPPKPPCDKPPCEHKPCRCERDCTGEYRCTDN